MHIQPRGGDQCGSSMLQLSPEFHEDDNTGIHGFMTESACLWDGAADGRVQMKSADPETQT